MDPMTIQLILFAVQQLIKAEPAIAAELQTVMSKNDPTPADWAALFAMAQKPWNSFGTDQGNINP